MHSILAGFIFFFGTIVGSFLNAVLWRLRTGESFVLGRSYCIVCRHELAAKDLLPILSYLLLGGKCRYCRGRISPSYLLIELATGALFLLAAMRVLPEGAAAIGAFDLSRLLLAWYVIAILIIVFVFDLRYMLILRSVTLPATVLAGVANVVLGMGTHDMLFGAIVGAGIFYIQYAASKGRWIGGGDIYLGLFMGAALGWPRILAALFLAYVVGAAVGATLMLFKRASWKTQIPFGTFLAAAAIASLLYGESMLSWYVGLVT
jgi:prepilin signal peptidase PulO-like enzyme (type II secretory pathway)